jgi:predicted N-acetyltransferase YhbS
MSKVDQLVQVEALASHREWVGLLARWHFAEWQRLYPGWSVEMAEEELSRHSDPNSIPTTLVAVEGMEPVGSVSLIEQDLAGWEHLTPWLASLYVEPHRRGRGIGKQLVRQAVAEAKRIGLAVLYLFTPGQLNFYAALGWRFVSQAVAAEEPVTILSMRLDEAEA